MEDPKEIIKKIFNISSQKDFEEIALAIFRFQALNCDVYSQYLKFLNTDIVSVTLLSEIPFIPIEFFKTHTIISGNRPVEKIFTSSGTTGIQQSKHHVCDLEIYKESFTKGFSFSYGDVSEYAILALLPSYLEREGSSLVYMAESLIKQAGRALSGFFLNDFETLRNTITQLKKQNQKTILLGVGYALLQFAEQHKLKLKHTIIMETGGMKGRHKEITKEELHSVLKSAFGVEAIHSEYGMTELLSQAYSNGNGRFFSPPWMKVFIRDINDPFSFVDIKKAGGINVIDLANIYSCSFIETKDLGRLNEDESFEVLGRFDNSDIRGCNLMVDV